MNGDVKAPVPPSPPPLWKKTLTQVRSYLFRVPSSLTYFTAFDSRLSITGRTRVRRGSRARVRGLSGTGRSGFAPTVNQTAYISLFQNAADFLVRRARIGRDRSASERSVINIHARHAGVHMCKSGSKTQVGGNRGSYLPAASAPLYTCRAHVDIHFKLSSGRYAPSPVLASPPPPPVPSLYNELNHRYYYYHNNCLSRDYCPVICHGSIIRMRSR